MVTPSVKNRAGKRLNRERGWLLKCDAASNACGGLLDQRCDSIGLRDVYGVAALDLDHRGTARLDMACWASGGIPLSSVAMRYQLGLALHAGSLILPLRAATPHGTWESAMNAAFSGSTSAAKEA